MKSNFRHIWAIPIGLGAISLVGLLAALVGDQAWDMIGWVSLGIPLVVIGRFIVNPRSAKKRFRSR